jgi:hypothetical protein
MHCPAFCSLDPEARDLITTDPATITCTLALSCGRLGLSALPIASMPLDESALAAVMDV